MSPDQFMTVGADHLWLDDPGDSAGDGTPLVLLHPGIADSTIWEGLAPLLNGHRVVRYDARGFGRSSAATEEFRSLDDLVAVLDRLGLDRVHLVGNSMGGEACLALAVTDPARVASMTLLCPGVGGYEFPENPDDAELYERFQALMAAGDLDGVGDLLLGYWCAVGPDEYLRTQLRASTRVDVAQDGLEQPNPEQWSHVDQIVVPTAVVAGDLDPPDSRQASIDLAGRIPGAELVRLEADHVPQYRDPEAVAAVVRRTIARAS